MRSVIRFICLLLVSAILIPVYAGAEMEIVVDVTIAPTPRVYRELTVGDEDTGESTLVFSVQQRLSALGYLKKEPDGVYDEDTERAVRDFQERNGLTAAGTADFDTQELLFSDLEKLVPAPTPKPTPRVVGAKGDDIRTVQAMLAQWGFLGGRVDGDFGGETENAIKSYKTYVHEAQQNYSDAHPTPTPVPTPKPTPEPTPVVAEGEQPIVVDRTADPTPVPTPTPIPYTPDAKIDDDLLAMLQDENFQVFSQLVSLGSKGSDVTRVQTRLGHLGYLYNGADGEFGDQTALALKFFQRRNGLEETGEADEITQRILFSADVKESTEYVFPYKLVVDVSEQKVYAYAWNGEKYDECVKKMTCSTGTKATPTPLGTFQAGGRCGGEWYYFKDFNCYAKYAFRIYRGILFHSVLYNSKKESSLSKGSVTALGSRASHGCVRLAVDDAKWIYNNCPAGVTVVVQN